MARPRGRPLGSTTERIWQDAMRKAAFELSRGRGTPRKIELAARAVVDAAVKGDMEAARIMGDRIDGRPIQQTNLAGHDGGPLDLSALSLDQLQAMSQRIVQTLAMSEEKKNVH